MIRRALAGFVIASAAKQSKERLQVLPWIATPGFARLAMTIVHDYSRFSGRTLAAKPQGHAQQSAVMGRRRSIHQQVVRDWLKNVGFPGKMPAAIFEKGAERKAKHASIDARLAA